MCFFMLSERQPLITLRGRFNRIRLYAGMVLGLLFIVVPASVGLAKAGATKRSLAARHSQYLCTAEGLLLFKISGRGILDFIPVTFADNLPLPQTDYINEMLPDPHSHSLYVSWIMTYNQGSAIVSEIDRMLVSRQSKLFSVFHQAFSPDRAGNTLRSVALGRRGRLLLVVFDSGLVSKTLLRVYRIQPRSPLRPVSKTLMLHSNFQSITTDPAGRFVYVTYTHDSHIYQYSVAPNAVLSPLAIPSIHTAGQPTAITFLSSGHFAYVANQGGSVTLYRVGHSGQLGSSANYSFGRNKATPNLAVTPNGRFLYICLPTGNTFQYRVLANGTLQPLTPKAIRFGGYKMIVDLTGRYAYSLSNTNGSNVIYQYRIQSDGTLLPLVPRFVSKIGTPRSMAIVQN